MYVSPKFIIFLAGITNEIVHASTGIFSAFFLKNHILRVSSYFSSEGDLINLERQLVEVAKVLVYEDDDDDDDDGCDDDDDDDED